MHRLPYIDSYKRGIRFITNNPMKEVWNKIELYGTVDNLKEVIKKKGNDQSNAAQASLFIRQSLELHMVSIDTSILIRPLMLYYSMLNLIRGMMLAYTGSFGEHTHGLRYVGAKDLLDCSAVVTSKGTFKRFAKSINAPDRLLDKQSYSLKELFSFIPEILPEFNLLKIGPSSVVRVQVLGYGNGVTELKYQIPNISKEKFESNWEKYFPWFKDICEISSPFSLKVKKTNKDNNDVANFCRKYLINELSCDDAPNWFDNIVFNEDRLLKRPTAYIAALFILSNISRYEPQLLNEPTIGLTNTGYLLKIFLEKCEQHFPQMMLELILSEPVYLG